MARWFQYPAKVEPVLVPAKAVIFVGVLLSEVIFPRSLIYQSKAEPVFSNAVLKVSVDKWLEPWSEPVRSRQFSPAQQISQVEPILPPTTTTTAVFTSSVSGDVIYPRSFIYQSYTSGRLPDPAKFLEGDYPPWSEPVRVKRGLAAYQQQSLAWGVLTPSAAPPVTAVVSAAVTPDVIFPRSFIYQAQTRPVLPPTTTTVPTFFNLVQGDTGVTFQSTIIYQVNTEALSPETHVFWYEPLSEPYLKKQGLAAHQQQFLAWGILTPSTPPPVVPAVTPAAISSDVVFPRSFIYQSYTTGRLPDPSKFLEGCYPPWRDPVRSKPGLLAAQQQAFIDGRAPITAAVAPTIGYWGWSEPVRLKTFLAAQQQTYASGFIPNPSTLLEGWQYPWSEPVRTRSLAAAQQQSFIDGRLPIPATPIIVTSAVSSQVIFKRRFIYQSKTESLFPIVATTAPVIGYWGLSEPVRVRPFWAALQQAYVSGSIPNPSTLLEGWQYPWSDPVRTRYLAAAQQQFFTDGRPPIAATVPIGFYGPFAEPVRLKAGLNAALQQAFTADTTVIPTSKIPAWLYAWSEPVRQKAGLKAWLQQTTAPTTPIYPNLIRTINWYAPFSEPVRIKKRLIEALQQFYTTGTAPLPNAVTVTMYAVETNNDVASFYIRVYNKPVKCIVSIKEIHHPHGAVASIEET